MPMTHVASVSPDGIVEPNSSQVICPWWSFTKTLISAAVLRLADQGEVVLDTQMPGRPFTVRQLLAQQAGLPDYGGLPAYHEAVARGDPPWSEGELLERFPLKRLAYPPGEGWTYSNVGYFLLRRLIEQTFCADFATALSALVLEPLGLETARVAQNDADIASTVFPGERPYNPGWVFHGVVVGPVQEAALALHGILNGELLKPATRTNLRERRHPLPVDRASPPWTKPGYGMGVMIGQMQSGGEPALWVIGHSAGGPGSTGSVFHDPASGRTAAAFTSDPARGANELAAYRRLAT